MNKEQSEYIIKKIEKNWKKIISNPKLKEGIPQYVFLKDRFRLKKGKISEDDKFKSSFQDFYKLNGAGLTPAFKKLYFKLLSESSNTTELRDILEQLYQIPIRRGAGKVHFSFATKLLHTIDDDRPIYDSIVAKHLRLGNIYTLKGKEAKIERCETIYGRLKERHADLLGNERVKNKIKEFSKKYSEAKDISNVKTLDFILWAYA